MKKCILINLLIMAFSFVSLVSADDDYTKVVLSKGLKGDTAEDVFTQNTKDKTYLVVFTNYVNYIDKSSVYATYIKMKKKGKIVVSAPRLVSTLVNKNYQPTVAYNASSNSYLVAWSCKLKSGDIQVLSRKLNAKGKPLGSIIKVASAGNTINSSPQLTYAYQADPSVKSAKKFVLLYDKALPAGANGLHGVFSVYLDDKGKRVGPEYHGFSSLLILMIMTQFPWRSVTFPNRGMGICFSQLTKSIPISSMVAMTESPILLFL